MSSIESEIRQILGTASASANGCSESEIKRVERSSGKRLPEAYRAFLTVMGNGVGSLFRGSDIFFPVCLEIQAWAGETLEENGRSRDLLENKIVLMIHGGYYFAALDLSKDYDNPSVIGYDERWNEFRPEAPSLLEWLRAYVREHLEMRSEIEALRKDSKD